MNIRKIKERANESKLTCKLTMLFPIPSIIVFTIPKDVATNWNNIRIPRALGWRAKFFPAMDIISVGKRTMKKPIEEIISLSIIL